MSKARPIRTLRRTTIYLFGMWVCVACHNEICFAFGDGDFQFWSTAGVSFRLNKDWTGTVEERLKFGNDAGHLYLHQTDLGFVYGSLADWIDIGFNFKQSFREDRDGHWSRENRPHLNVTFKGRLGTLDVSDRSRLEYRDKEHQEDLWRYVNKFEIKLPCELTAFRFRPYVADLVYINLQGHAFEQNRIYCGVTFDLSKNVESGLYYAWQLGKYDGHWIDRNAIGLQIKIPF
ncbi:MAG: DUF2490 domain-containing protein [Phycisphaerales bacterium]|nr:MAG: DUF2490 domain-containing protein [Phycisphaerales bacterium]